MIRLNTLMVALCAIAVATMTAVFYRQANVVLARQYDELEKMQLESVRQFVNSAVEAKKYLLEAHRETLGGDIGLGRSFLSARAKDATYDGRSEAEQIRKRLTCDIVEVVALKDTRRLSPFLAPSVLKRAVSEEASGTLLARVNDREVLLSYSPLKVFGGSVAVLLLGYDLNGRMAQEILAGTRSRVRFVSLGKTSTDKKVFPLIQGTKQASIGVEIAVDVVQRLNREASGGVALIGILSLLFSVLILYAMQHFLFLKSFRRVLVSIKKGSSFLNKGKILELRAGRFPTHEVTELSRSISTYTHSLTAFQKQVERKTRDEVVGKITSQVVHDLGGTILVLSRALEMNDLEELSPDRRKAVRESLSRLQSVANGISGTVQRALENDSSGSTEEILSVEPLSVEIVPVLLDAVVSEKRAFRGDSAVIIRLVPGLESFAVYSRVRHHEFYRAVSNLIDNASHACGKHGEVLVSFGDDEHGVFVEVADSGSGIPADLIPQLGRRGVTFGKSGGSGLGLWQARVAVESWGGSLSIKSQPGEGTEVRLSLPLSASPAWLAAEIQLPPSQTVVVLDDDPTVSALWEERLRAVAPALRLISFERVEQLLVAQKRGEFPDDTLFLCDYEFPKENWTGIEAIEELGVPERSVLVTGRAGDAAIQRECLQIGVKLLPKVLLPFIAIHSSVALQKGRAEGQL